MTCGRSQVRTLVRRQALHERLTTADWRWLGEVACARVGGRAIAVTGGTDRSVHLWNIIAGRKIGPPLSGHTAPIRAVTCVEIDGQPFALTSDESGVIRIWGCKRDSS